MAVLTYNSVALPYVDITSFEQRALEDESRTDWCGTEFDIKVQAILNPSYIQIRTGAGVLLTNPADIMSTLRTLLLARRKRLSLKFNGVELIPQIQVSNAGTVDAQNGPKPISCQLLQLTNTTFLLVYHIQASYWENNTVAPASSRVNRIGNDVLYNRWSEAVDIDDLNLSKRTRQGKMMIRSDNTDGVIPDQLRSQMAVVGVPAGFLRTNARYTVDPSGLKLEYSVEDREVYKMPAFPAFKAEGEYTETAPKYGGAQRIGHVRIRLSGDKATSQQLLAGRALTIATYKLLSNTSVANPADASHALQYFDASMRVGMYENWVEVSLSCRYIPDDGDTKVHWTQGGISAEFAAFWASKGIRSIVVPGGVSAGMVYTPLTDEGDIPEYTPAYLDRGTAGILLQAAAYYDPSITLANNKLAVNGAVALPIIAPVITTNQDGALSQMKVGLQPGQAGKRQEA